MPPIPKQAPGKNKWSFVHKWIHEQRPSDTNIPAFESVGVSSYDNVVRYASVGRAATATGQLLYTSDDLSA